MKDICIVIYYVLKHLLNLRKNEWNDGLHWIDMEADEYRHHKRA